MSNVPRRHITLTAITAAVFSVVLATSSATASSAANTALGTPKSAKASLAPVTVGFINQDTGSVSAYPEGKAAALAAQSYVNSYLGGVAGHPLKIDTCSTDGTLTSDQNCAQQMVSDKVTYVQSGISFNSYAWEPILGPAGIPIIGFNPFTAQEYLEKDAYSFGALPAGAAGVVQKIGTLPGVKKVALVFNTVAGSLAAVPLLQHALSSLGVTSTVVTYAEGTPNLLATYVTAKSSGADAIIASLSTPDCIAFAQATASQNNTLPIGFLGTCITPSVFKAVGNDMNGWYTTAELQNPNAKTAQASIYRAAMHKYASSAALSPTSQDAFSNVLTGYYEILKPVGPSVTSASALKAITNPAGGQVFMGPSYKCPGSILPVVCGTSVAVMRVKNPGALYAPGYLNASKTFAAELK